LGGVCAVAPTPTVAATAAAPTPSECKSARRLTLLREEMSASLNVLRSIGQVLLAIAVLGKIS
jgi:hypothetical protein